MIGPTLKRIYLSNLWSKSLIIKLTRIYKIIFENICLEITCLNRKASKTLIESSEYFNLISSLEIHKLNVERNRRIPAYLFLFPSHLPTRYIRAVIKQILLKKWTSYRIKVGTKSLNILTSFKKMHINQGLIYTLQFDGYLKHVRM